MTENQKSYQIYLNSNNWKYIRAKALERDNHKCFECDSLENLQVHHTCYRTSPYQTKLTDLVTLCKKCHEKEHRIVRDEYGKIVNFEQMSSYLQPNRSPFKKDYPKDPIKVYNLQQKNKKIRKFLKLKKKKNKFTVYGRYHR